MSRFYGSLCRLQQVCDCWSQFAWRLTVQTTHSHSYLSLELIAHVGLESSEFFPTCSCTIGILVWHSLAVYSLTNSLCHWTIFLLVFHKVNHLRPFQTSMSAVSRLSSCVNSCRFLYFIKSTTVQCLCLFSDNLVAYFLLPTHFQSRYCSSSLLTGSSAELVWTCDWTSLGRHTVDVPRNQPRRRSWSVSDGGWTSVPHLQVNTLRLYRHCAVEVSVVGLSSNSTGTSFPVTSSRTCWGRRQFPRNKLLKFCLLYTSPSPRD